MKNLIKFYLEIINEEIGHFKVDDYDQFLKMSIKFEENGILSEDKNLLIDIPNETIQFVLKNDNRYLNVNEFKETFKLSKHWNNVKNIDFGEIYFGVFDFNNKIDIDNFHIKCFNFDDVDLNEYYNVFIIYCKNIFGFYNSINNKHIICVNSKSKNVIQTLYHELSHFIQNIGDIRIIEKNLNENQKEKIRNDINNEELSNKVLSYFSGKEYVIHIDDLIFDLKRMRDKFYKNDNFNFLKELGLFLNKCKKLKYGEILKEDFFIKFLKSNNNEYESLMMLIYSFKIGFKSQKIFNILNNVLIKLK